METNNIFPLPTDNYYNLVSRYEIAFEETEISDHHEKSWGDQIGVLLSVKELGELLDEQKALLESNKALQNQAQEFAEWTLRSCKVIQGVNGKQNKWKYGPKLYTTAELWKQFEEYLKQRK